MIESFFGFLREQQRESRKNKMQLEAEDASTSSNSTAAWNSLSSSMEAFEPKMQQQQHAARDILQQMLLRN